jgi:hypothetical protein
VTFLRPEKLRNDHRNDGRSGAAKDIVRSETFKLYKMKRLQNHFYETFKFTLQKRKNHSNILGFTQTFFCEYFNHSQFWLNLTWPTNKSYFEVEFPTFELGIQKENSTLKSKVREFQCGFQI